MSFDLKSLQEKRNKILIDMQAIATHKDGWTNESRTQFDKLDAEARALDGDIQRAQNLAKMEAEARSFVRVPRPGTIGVNGGDQEQRSRINEAFRSYARYGLGGMSQEQRDLLTTSDATGGALIPQEFFPELTNALKFYGPVATKVKQRVTDGTGRLMKVSLGNDTQNGLTLMATEGTSQPQETDPSFQSKPLGTDTVSGGLVKISVEEMADSAFNLDSAIRDYFAVRYGRGLEAAITTGKDSAGTVLPNQSAGGLLGIATAGTTTKAVADNIGWTDIVNTFGALDPAYSSPTASWMFNSNTRATLLAMVDGFGRPFWTPDPTSDSPFGKLLGFDVVLNQSMPNFAASATPILFGDLQRAYMLRTDGQPSVVRLNERFMDQLEVGFLMYSRIGGISLNAGVSPLVALKIAAS